MDKGKPKTTSMTPVNPLVVSWTPSGTPLSAIATGTSMASIDNPARQTSTPAINSSRDRDTAAQVSIRRSVDGQPNQEGSGEGDARRNGRIESPTSGVTEWAAAGT